MNTPATLRSRLIRWAKLLLIGYVCYAIILFFLQRWLLFPGQFFPVTAGEPLQQFEALPITSAGEAVEVRLLPPITPPDKPAQSKPAPLIIYTHGNGEMIEDWAGPLSRYRRLGCYVALVEYPGYGRSKGCPSQAAITDVMIQTFDRLSRRPEIDPKRIVLHGRSLGGGAACALAKQRDIAALILESTFSDVRAYAARFGLPGFLCRDPFDNRALLATWNKPCLILHGTADQVIPLWHAERNRAACTTAEFITVAGRNHNDQPGIFETHWPEFESFLLRHRLVDQPVE